MPNRVYCPSCKEAVFESNVPLQLKGITFERLYDGRRRWYSRTFLSVVHECGVDLSETFGRSPGEQSGTQPQP